MVEPDLSYGIHWFRRDLRVAGNPALQHNWKENGGRVLGFFCFDKKFLARDDFSANRFQFFLKTLEVLREELREIGSDMLVLDIGPEDAYEDLFAQLKKHKLPLPTTVSWNVDYEPYAIARDHKMEDRFKKAGVGTHQERDHVLIEPHEIFKDGDPDSAYQIYTPFKNRWVEHFRSMSVQARVEVQKKGLIYLNKRIKGKSEKIFSLDWPTLFKKKIKFPDFLEIYLKENASAVDVPIPEAGSAFALQQVRAFKSKIDDYGRARDIPGERGTSGFSIYFKNGSLTIAQVIAELDLKAFGKKDESGRAKFFSELIWREFYYYILARFPYVEKSAFKTRYSDIKWENKRAYFNAWKEGRTGYPIVDAGMRQLNTTGWMHNRVRMIVSSFLMKDLLIDYRWGEKYFMEKLLDGDLAPNNGGWQWAASTGCDAQPYFRIFNPQLQSEKFDPEGNYIKKYVKELAHVSAKDIHDPDDAAKAKGYPDKIVDHHEQKQRAIALFK